MPGERGEIMRISIYQIDLEKDTEHLCFRDLPFIRKKCKGIFPTEIYIKVYSGKVDASTLEDVFTIFNIRHPLDYKGRSMTQSDVVEVCSESGESRFYFCDTYCFIPIEFAQRQEGQG